MRKTGKNREFLQAELLFGELLQFRKGQGLTHWKLNTASQLKKIVSGHTGLPGKELSASQLHAYLLYEIDKLGVGPLAEALRHAFAIGGQSGRTLTERREDLALQLGRHPDTIKAYENQALKELAYRLSRAEEKNALPSRTMTPVIERSTPHQLKALRNAATESLKGLYSLGENGSKILQTLGRGGQPFLDVEYHCALFPSEEGPDRYNFTFKYRFRAARTTFRLGACASPQDTSALMATGLVDDIIQFDHSADLSSEKSLSSWRLTVHDTSKDVSKSLTFSELSRQETKDLLEGFWQMDANSCRILEATVPDSFRGDDVVYEIRATLELDFDGHYAFWEAPSLMYLNTITIDLSAFNNHANWHFSVKPFLGNLFPAVVESERRIFHLSVNSWITPGHGVVIIWR